MATQLERIHDRVVGVASGSGANLDVTLFGASTTDKPWWIVVDFILQDSTTNANMSGQRIAAIVKGNGTTPVITSVNITAQQTNGSIIGGFSIVASGTNILARWTNGGGITATLHVHAEIFK